VGHTAGTTGWESSRGKGSRRAARGIHMEVRNPADKRG
jgi:hypothetical protein